MLAVATNKLAKGYKFSKFVCLGAIAMLAVTSNVSNDC